MFRSVLEVFPTCFFANLVKFLLCFVLCASILSVVSLSFINLFHLFLMLCSFRVLSCITHSHLRTHIRWAALDRRICRSHNIALFFGEWCWFWLSLVVGSFGSDRHPIPRMIPRLTLGQR